MKQQKKVLIIEHAEGRAESMPKLINFPGIKIVIARTYLGDPLPASKEIDAVITGGGPMGIYEIDKPEYLFLKKECGFIADMIAKGRAVLGVCLGHELLAYVLGAKVKKSELNTEIGWSKVSLKKTAVNDPLFLHMPGQFWVFQYHNDCVTDLPKNSIHLAWSPKCPIEAFRYSNKPIWGVQFHPEVSPKKAKRILDSQKEKLERKGIDVTALIKQGVKVDHKPRKQIFRNFVNALN